MVKTYLRLAFADLVINSVLKLKTLNTNIDIKITNYLKSFYKDKDNLLNFLDQEKIKKDKLKLHQAFNQTKLLPEDGDELSEIEVNNNLRTCKDNQMTEKFDHKYEIKRIF